MNAVPLVTLRAPLFSAGIKLEVPDLGTSVEQPGRCAPVILAFAEMYAAHHGTSSSFFCCGLSFGAMQIFISG